MKLSILNFVHILHTNLLHCSTRVSNELGFGPPCVAWLSMHIGVCMESMEALMIVSTLFYVRTIWGYVYRNEGEVVDFISIML